VFKHNLFSLLSTFTSDELKKFSDFLQSKYFVTNKKLYPLFSILEKFYPSFQDEKLTKKFLFEKLYPGKTYHDSTIRDLLSELLDKCEEFLKVDNLYPKNIDAEIELLNTLCTRKQYKLFLKKKKILDDYFNNNQLWAEQPFDKVKYDIALLDFDIYTQIIKNTENIQKRIELLNSISFESIITGVVLIINNETRKHIYNRNYGAETETTKFESYLNSVDEFLNKCDFNRQTISFINYKINFLYYKTFRNREDYNAFNDYRLFFENNKHYLDKDAIFDHYVNILNHCIAVKRSPETIEILFRIYNDILINKYYINKYEKYLNPDFYRGVIMFGIEQSKFDWVRNIIDNYNDCFEPSIRNKMYNYSMAQIEIADGDTLKALDYLNDIDLENFIFKYDLYNLKLKIYYINNYFEEALSLVKAYNAFIRNNKLKNKEEKLIYKKYVDIMELLIQYKCGKKKNKLEDISFELSKEGRITFKDWLKEEVQKLLIEK